MREIKFRAFPKDCNEAYDRIMVSGNDFCLGEDFQPLVDCFRDVQEAWHVMQFTGLLDRNGKEIYEGDIVKSNKSPDWCDPIVYTDGSFCSGKLPLKQIIIKLEQLEIIGNIYENPELVEKAT